MGKTKARPHQPTEEAFAEAAGTMRLATGALDHPDPDDAELERLCDEALSPVDKKIEKPIETKE